jgi:hypothetical protein
MAISVAIDFLSTSGEEILYELTILKVIETKSTVTNTPQTPLHTQAQQIVSLDEINQSDSDLIGDTSGALSDLFDRDDTTEALFDGLAGSGADIYLKAPIMLSRIVVGGGTLGIPNSAVITVYDVAGVAHIVYDGTVHNLGPQLVPGIDTGNFKWQPGVEFSDLPGLANPDNAHHHHRCQRHSQAPWTISRINALQDD